MYIYIPCLLADVCFRVKLVVPTLAQSVSVESRSRFGPRDSCGGGELQALESPVGFVGSFPAIAKTMDNL